MQCSRWSLSKFSLKSSHSLHSLGQGYLLSSGALQDAMSCVKYYECYCFSSWFVFIGYTQYLCPSTLWSLLLSICSLSCFIVLIFRIVLWLYTLVSCWLGRNLCWLWPVHLSFHFWYSYVCWNSLENNVCFLSWNY